MSKNILSSDGRFAVVFLDAEELRQQEVLDEDEYLPKWNAEELLQISFDNAIVRVESDGGDPEDQFFCRGWNWVARAIMDAYEFGRLNNVK